MSRQYRWHRAARKELKEAVEFYRDESPGLGEVFLAEVQASIEFVREHPLAGSPAPAGLRAKLVSRFPYTLFYRDHEDLVQIFAVAHHRRKPGYWIPRVR